MTSRKREDIWNEEALDGILCRSRFGGATCRILFSLRSCSSWLRLLPRLPVTSIFPSILSSLTWFRRQFLGKAWPVWLTFLRFIVCRRFLSSMSLCNRPTSLFLARSVQLISILPQHHISNLPTHCWSTVRSVPLSAPNKAMLKM